jgi:hypothetical protein
MFGDLTGDLLGGTWSASSWVRAVANFFTSFIAYRPWDTLDKLALVLADLFEKLNAVHFRYLVVGDETVVAIRSPKSL